MTGQPAPQLSAPVVGFPASQAYLTAQVYNPLTFLLNPPSAYLYASSTQTVGTSANTLITVNTASFDPYSALNASAHTWVAPVAGWYEVTGTINWTGATGGNRAAWLTTDPVGLGAITATETWGQPGSANVTCVCGGTVLLTAGQSLALVGYQSSGGNLGTNNAANSCASLRIRFSHML